MCLSATAFALRSLDLCDNVATGQVMVLNGVHAASCLTDVTSCHVEFGWRSVRYLIGVRSHCLCLPMSSCRDDAVMRPHWRPFSQRLQRSPPMVWDLDYEAEESEEEAMVSIDLSQEDGSIDQVSMDGSPSMCSSHDPSPPRTFDLQFDAHLLTYLEQPSGDAEIMSHCLLRLGKVTQEELRKLFDLLPVKSLLRNETADDGETGGAACIHFGAYCYGGVSGCHKTVRDFPWTCCLLAAVTCSVDADHCFTTISLILNSNAAAHTDSHNEEDMPNLLISLCDGVCLGGGIWVADAAGDVHDPVHGPGFHLPLSIRGFKFNARCVHRTCEYVGERYILVAFHIRQSWRVSPDEASHLSVLGFRFREYAPELMDPYV